MLATTAHRGVLVMSTATIRVWMEHGILMIRCEWGTYQLDTGLLALHKSPEAAVTIHAGTQWKSLDELYEKMLVRGARGNAPTVGQIQKLAWKRAQQLLTLQRTQQEGQKDAPQLHPDLMGKDK
jgi:hypothetical protein